MCFSSFTDDVNYLGNRDFGGPGSPGFADDPGFPADDFPPVILEHPRSTVIVPEDESVTLNCHTSGRPKPEITWLRIPGNFSGTDPGLKNVPGTRVETTTSNAGSHRILLPDGSLFFLRTREHDDAGIYWCVAENRYGRAKSRNATLQVACEYRSMGALNLHGRLLLLAHAIISIIRKLKNFMTFRSLFLRKTKNSQCMMIMKKIYILPVSHVRVYERITSQENMAIKHNFPRNPRPLFAHGLFTIARRSKTHSFPVHHGVRIASFSFIRAF